MAIVATIAPDKKTSNVHQVFGTVALGGTNPTDVTIPSMTTILWAGATLNIAAPPGDNTECLGVSWSGNTLSIEGYKNTSGSDPTLVDSDGTETVAYTVVGH